MTHFRIFNGFLTVVALVALTCPTLVHSEESEKPEILVVPSAYLRKIRPIEIQPKGDQTLIEFELRLPPDPYCLGIYDLTQEFHVLALIDSLCLTRQKALGLISSRRSMLSSSMEFDNRLIIRSQRLKLIGTVSRCSVSMGLLLNKPAEAMYVQCRISGPPVSRQKKSPRKTASRDHSSGGFAPLGGGAPTGTKQGSSAKTGAATSNKGGDGERGGSGKAGNSDSGAAPIQSPAPPHPQDAQELWAGIPAELRAVVQAATNEGAAPSEEDRRNLISIGQKLRILSPIERDALLQIIRVSPKTPAAELQGRMDALMQTRQALQDQATLLQARADQGAPAEEDQAKLQHDLQRAVQDENLKDYAQLDATTRKAMAQRIVRKQSALHRSYQLAHPVQTLGNIATGLLDLKSCEESLDNALAEIVSGSSSGLAKTAAVVSAARALNGTVAVTTLFIGCVSLLTGLVIAPITPVLIATAGIGLGLAAIESELRVAAAVQAKTPEDFVKQVELAAQLDAEFKMGVAFIIVAEVIGVAVKFPQIKAGVLKAKAEMGSAWQQARVISTLRAQYRADLAAAMAEGKQVADRYRVALSGVTDAEQLFSRLAQGDPMWSNLLKIEPARARQLLATAKSPLGKNGMMTMLAELKGSQEKVEIVLEKWKADLGAQFEQHMEALASAKTPEQRVGVLTSLQSLLDPQDLTNKLQQTVSQVLQAEAAGAEGTGAARGRSVASKPPTARPMSDPVPVVEPSSTPYRPLARHPDDPKIAGGISAYRQRYQKALEFAGKPPLPPEWDVHHSIPKAVLPLKIPGLEKIDIHAPENLRGIPGARAKNLPHFHQLITNEWNIMLESRNPILTLEEIFRFRDQIDLKYKQYYWEVISRGNP